MTRVDLDAMLRADVETEDDAALLRAALRAAIEERERIEAELSSLPDDVAGRATYVRRQRTRIAALRGFVSQVEARLRAMPRHPARPSFRDDVLAALREIAGEDAFGRAKDAARAAERARSGRDRRPRYAADSYYVVDRVAGHGEYTAAVRGAPVLREDPRDDDGFPAGAIISCRDRAMAVRVAELLNLSEGREC